MSESFSFADADIPGVTESGETPQLSSDLACEVCGTPLVYGGRGRKPRYCDEHRRGSSGGGSSPRRGTDAAGQALAVMDNFYGLISMALVSFAPRTAMNEWSGKPDVLQARNAAIFAADPKLAKSIASVGSKGGAPAFYLTNGLVILPVIASAARELSTKAAERKAQRQPRPTPQPSRPSSPPPSSPVSPPVGSTGGVDFDRF